MHYVQANPLKDRTHLTDTKEHVPTDPTVVSPHVSASWPTVALEHTAKTSADGQEARTHCACVSGNNSPYQQAAVVCIRHSKEATGRQTG